MTADELIEAACDALEKTLMCYNNCCDAEFLDLETNVTMTWKQAQEAAYAEVEEINKVFGMLSDAKCDVAKPKCME